MSAERPRGLNASGLPDPTATAAIERASRDEGPLPAASEVRRMRGRDLGNLARRLRIKTDCKGDREMRDAVIAELGRRARARRKGEGMAKVSGAPDAAGARVASEWRDYMGALAAQVAAANSVAAKLDAIASKLDDLTLAVMDLKGAGGAAAGEGAAPLPEVPDGPLTAYVSALDPLFLVGRGVSEVAEGFHGWCGANGFAPCPGSRLAAKVAELHPLHVDGTGRFAAGKGAGE